jgi:hypothetical protein
MTDEDGILSVARRRGLEELTDVLDELVVHGEAEAATREWAERFASISLAVNLSAKIPDERLEEWLKADKQFHDTWFRSRLDLPDQSQGSYDLALASFGLHARLPEQEIVDLIVHHRSIHKQKERTRVDYFQRLITRAAGAGPAEDEMVSSEGALPGSAPPRRSWRPSGSGPPTVPDAAAQKAFLCDSLSKALGAKIYKIIKISGQSPVFHMFLAEGTAEFSTTARFLSQKVMRNSLANFTGRLMRQFKAKEWEVVAQSLLAACTVEEGGEEMDLEESARLRLFQYLSGSVFIESLEGQTREDSRRPMIDAGFVTVCASDIQNFIAKTTTEKITIPAVVGMLAAVGAKSKRFRGKFPEQSRWILPPSKFPAGEYVTSTKEE